MTAQLYGPINLDLNDGPIEVKIGLDGQGRPFARLVLGDLTQAVAISVTNSNPETLADLQSAVAELASWVQQAQKLHGLPAVA
ncbi:hypothetical protein ADK57_32045 [Streptomyces sp. MMG1533]|uniref:hypothetical protein n=1 Tax=Streptomyces sp. MMG1533 TaxID=1415546 RepID=UPI0006AECFC3|nr:hypothetical protein [Streptomyces sp. MMG1533]KOU59903.1 hypothetical protein ADK57_32045 [Streptomyces sp. MMG1533]